MNDHPEWLVDILRALKALWPLDRQLNVVLEDADFFMVNRLPTADGLCQVQDGLITIYILRDAGDEDHLRDVFFHEYCHAAIAPLLRDFDWSLQDAPDRVMMVEGFVRRFSGLLLYAYQTGAYPTQGADEHDAPPAPARRRDGRPTVH